MDDAVSAVGADDSAARLLESGPDAAGDLRFATSSTSTIRQVAEPAELACVFDPEVQIVCLKRQPNSSIARALDALVSAGTLGSGFRIALPADVPLRPDALPGIPHHGALYADIAFLLDLYADLVGCPALGLRLEITECAMCPRFHTDRVGIRLLCTYRGPATEWLDEAWADRSKLGAAAGGLPDDASGLIRDPTQVGRAEPFDLVLLKGGAWPGNERLGAIHRSPPVPTEVAPRVLISIDALWTET